MRKALLLLPALALGGCATARAHPEYPARPAVVRIEHFRFVPATQTIREGQVVRWQNAGVTLHAVRGRGFFSRAFAPGTSWPHRFSRRGVYAYVCTLHPQTMRGTIVVR